MGASPALRFFFWMWSGGSPGAARFLISMLGGLTQPAILVMNSANPHVMHAGSLPVLLPMMLMHASLNSGIAAVTDFLSPFSAQMVHSSSSSPARPRPCAVLMTFTVAFQYSTLSFLAIFGSTLTSLFLPEICFGSRRGKDDGQSRGRDEESLGKIWPKRWENGIFWPRFEFVRGEARRSPSGGLPR